MFLVQSCNECKTLMVNMDQELSIGSGAEYLRTPLAALRHSTRGVLSQLLNGPKIIPSPSNLPRDWRGLAHIARVNCPHVGCSDPTAVVLSSWEKDTPSIQQLLDALKEIDRWDVIDDIGHLIDKDVVEYAKNIDNGKSQVHEELNDLDDIILTRDDPQCIETCGQPQYYDAFLLFDDSDREFAFEMLDKLEREYGMKLCTKDRDLIGGLPFEHAAIMQLIRERCRRLIVIVSPTFLKSPANNFFITFAQAVGLEQQQRKIIPCIYLKFPRPPQLSLSFYCVLDFTRTSHLWNNWERLSQSLRSASPRPSQPRAILPANCSLPSTALSEASGTKEYKQLKTEQWECQKKNSVVGSNNNITNLTTQENSSLVNESKKSRINEEGQVSLASSELELSYPPNLSKDNSPLSTSESISGQSESEQMLRNSRSSSTTSLLSKVFTQRRFSKPKSWFKKKKKVAVSVHS